MRRNRGWLSLIVIAASGVVGAWVLYTGPKTVPQEEVRRPKLVETVQVQPATHRITVRAYGTVIPSHSVTIEPEVSGQIIRQHPALIPGGTILKGEELFGIDRRLMELSLSEAQANVERAEANLAEAVRKRDETRRLAAEDVLSESELAALESGVKVQEAELKRLKAGMARTEELLSRHQVVAPFNALVLEESVEVGQRVDPGFAAATLVGTDTFWVRASLPVDQLRWIRTPENGVEGAMVDIYVDTGNGHSEHHAGRLIRLLGDIESEGRMARVLIRVNDPLEARPDSETAPLLLGTYVQVEIEAGELKNVYRIDRAAVREGDTVWIVNNNSQLEIRNVVISWRKGEVVYVKDGLEPGQSIIVSPLRVALPGMDVHARDITPASAQSVTMTRHQ